jgi:hypothetical protein
VAHKSWPISHLRQSFKIVWNCVDNRGKIDDTIYMAVMVNERSKGITTMAQYGLSGETTVKCVCERCEDVYHIDITDETLNDLRYMPIVSLSDAKISSEDFVCVTCLTESESIQFDAFATWVLANSAE